MHRVWSWCAITPTHTQTQVMRMRLQWSKDKADRGCEKLPRYLKTRGEDENMFLSASGRNRGHCTANAVEGTMRADEPARILPPHLAIPKWCELHSRRYYKNRQDAHACDTFLTPPYMDKLALLVDRVRVCPCLFRCWSLFLSLSCLLALSLSLPLVVLL